MDVTPRHPSVKILQYRQDLLQFVLSDTDNSVANALRRVMMAEVPTMAIDLVDVHRNSSVLHDEMIAHRLGLVPIRWKNTKTLLQKEFSFYWEDHDCQTTGTTACPKCCLTLHLQVDNTNTGSEADTITVTSKDLQIIWDGQYVDSEEMAQKCPFEIAHFSHDLDESRAIYDNAIVIAKLGAGQGLSLRCIARMGIGKLHAKFNPTATVSMRRDVQINLNEDLISKLSVSDMKQFCDNNLPGIFRFDKENKKILIDDLTKVTNIDEIRRIGAEISTRAHFAENFVSARFIPERFIFTVEPSGSLDVKQIFESAMDVLIGKMDMVERECADILRM